MGRKYELIHKRKKVEEEKPEEPIDIDNIDDEELGKLIKAGLIKWQDIKKRHEKKEKNEKREN